MSDNLAIGVMTSPNLKERYTACLNTWVEDFNNVFLFGENSDQFDENLIPIKGAGEDWESLLKQQLGLKYMYESNPNFDWYCIVGCDNVLFKNKILEELKKYNSNEDIFLAQPCGLWTDFPSTHEIQNESDSHPMGMTWRSIAGGAGFFISNSLMHKCYKIIDEFTDFWIKMSGDNWYADLAISYMIKKYFNIIPTHLVYLLSQSPSHFENIDNHIWYESYPIPILEILKTPMILHYVKPVDMKIIYEKYR